jgi:hypothetical protein
MSRIEKFGRRRPEAVPESSLEPRADATGSRGQLPPRSETHPSLQPRLTKLLMNALMLLFILLACSLFFWGRSLFAPHGSLQNAAGMLKGACQCTYS